MVHQACLDLRTRSSGLFSSDLSSALVDFAAYYRLYRTRRVWQYNQRLKRKIQEVEQNEVGEIGDAACSAGQEKLRHAECSDVMNIAHVLQDPDQR